MFAPHSLLSSGERLHCAERHAVDYFEPWLNVPTSDEHFLCSLTAVGEKIILFGGRLCNSDWTDSRLCNSDWTDIADQLFCLRLTM